MRQILSWAVLATVLGISAEAPASMALRLTYDDLIQQSDRIVVAELMGESSAWEGSRILTTYTFEVREEFAGQGERRFTLIQPGGTVGDLSQKTFGYPAFAPKERYLLMLTKVQDRFRVVGLSQGVFAPAVQDGQEVFLQRVEGLSFTEGDARPIVLSRPLLSERIQKVWRKVLR